MIFQYCPNCKAERGFKRNLGWGTFFAVVITLGWWICAIPFYPKRCIECGREIPPPQRPLAPPPLHAEGKPFLELAVFKSWWTVIVLFILSFLFFFGMLASMKR